MRIQADFIDTTGLTMIHSKLPNIGTTIFTVMTQLAMEHQAINLSQGFPDFEAPKELHDRLNWHITQGKNQYAPMIGIAPLRQAIANKTKNLYGRDVSADKEITICAGATEGIYAAITAIIQPGDEVIVFDPAYDCYQPAITLNGGICRHIPLDSPHFTPNWQRVTDTINKKTRAIIINSPHNPSGSIFTKDDILALEQLVSQHGLYVISDEVYEHMVFDGSEHLSVNRYPALFEKSFIISSFGKTYHTTGWKIGYCIAPPAMTNEFRKIHQFLTFSVFTPAQYAYADYLESNPEHYRQLPHFYERKRDLFCELIQPAGFQLTPTAGTYFQLVDFSPISTQHDEDFAVHLTQNIGVAAIPISVFYESCKPSKWVRFCFAKDDATLRKAAEKLCTISS